MTAIANPRTPRLFPAPRLVTASVSGSRRAPDDGHARRAEPTPLFTRHMLGAIEAERDRRRQGRRLSGTRRAERRQPAISAVHPRLTATPAGLTTRSTAAVLMERPDLDRWTDDGGRAVSATTFTTADDARLAAANVRDHAASAVAP